MSIDTDNMPQWIADKIQNFRSLWQSELIDFAQWLSDHFYNQLHDWVNLSDFANPQYWMMDRGPYLWCDDLAEHIFNSVFSGYDQMTDFYLSEYTDKAPGDLNHDDISNSQFLLLRKILNRDKDDRWLDDQ